MRTSPLASVLLSLAAARWCVCAPHLAPSIAVAVHNYAGVPRSVLATAIEVARRAFYSAGVESRWTLCPSEHCEVTEDSRDAAPRIEVFVMPTLLTPPPGASDRHPAGYAMTGGFPHPRAYAFYDAARSAADRTLRPLSLVLGCIFIHETGHLLGLTHQRHGAMRPNLEGVDMDNAVRGWAFSSEERRKLREAVGCAQKVRAIARR
jgi:hypothetical protein